MRITKTQPPVGYRIPATRILRAFAGAGFEGAVDTFLEDFAGTLGARQAFAVSSGKAALVTVLRALHRLTGRRKVIIPAYTCYSVPSAIVKAGLEPVACDIEVDGFDYDYGQLEPLLGSDVLCALSIHLFGIPSDTRRLKTLCEPAGIFVVEDSAQALGISENGRWLGTRGDVGFFSLGRGKNLTTGAGGLIITDSEVLCRALREAVRALSPAGVADDARTCLTLAVLGVFIWPRLYWLPAGLPFLQLGETIFHDDFPVSGFSGFRAELLRDWWTTLQRLNERRRRAADFYLRKIPRARDYARVPYLRFPLIVPSPERRRLLLEESGRPLGVSRMYPESVGAIPQLQGRLERHDFPEASRVAGSLVTLPTHPLVCDRDLGRICMAVNEALVDQPA